MNGLPQYLNARADRIRALPTQTLPKFRRNYLGWEERPMRALYARFPQLSAQREDVIQLYIEWTDPVLALVATMVWGFIDTAKQNRLQQVLAVPEVELCARMERIRVLIFAGNTADAYLSCCPGGINHIPGIGPSYFTKIFFYLGQAAKALSRKPLILDKWTTNGFFAVYGQIAGSQALRRYFHFPSPAALNKYRSIPLKPDRPIQAAAYHLFNECMNDWATQLRVPAATVEQFVFGTDLRRDKSAANPRNELLTIIRTLIV